MLIDLVIKSGAERRKRSVFEEGIIPLGEDFPNSRNKRRSLGLFSAGSVNPS